MAIRFDCECGKKLSAPDHYAGREGKCSHCGKRFIIPGEPRPPVEERATQALPEGNVGLLTYQVNPKAVARAAVQRPANKISPCGKSVRKRNGVFMKLSSLSAPLDRGLMLRHAVSSQPSLD